MPTRITVMAFLAVGPAMGSPARGVAAGEFISRVPPLKHERAERWPMVAWVPFLANATNDTFSRGLPEPATVYRELDRRGLTQAIGFDEKFIPMARALQQAGCKVIVVQGEGGAGPGAEGPDPYHKRDAGYSVKDAVNPCPLLLEGWHIHAMKARALLRRFKGNGITLDGLWMDSETQPWGSKDEWEQSRHCSRCRDLFPPGVLDTALSYRAFIGRFKQDLYSAYMAAPALEVFPKCLVLNWGLVYSTAELPTHGYWGNMWYSPRSAGLFTGLNPVAYGHDTISKDYWREAWPDPAKAPPLDAEHMDRLYTRVMLSQISQNAANAQTWAPEKLCVPWVCRYCPETQEPKVPALTRPRYREILRHIWLRGADSMQIFNPPRPEMPGVELDELADAVQIYDEVLGFRDFLDKGEILNTGVPLATFNGAVWSGLKLPDQALIRAFTQGPTNVVFSVQPWLDKPALALEAGPEGRYYLVKPDGRIVRRE